MNGIANLQDVAAIEAVGMPADFPQTTYDLLKHGASLNPDATALSFFLQTADYKTPTTLTYRQLLQKITQTANFFRALGADKDTVIALILPNLPEMHFAIWGGQAAGIVMPINPLLEPKAIAELLTSVKARIVVTLAPFPKVDIWQKVSQVLPNVPSVEQVVLINLAYHVKGVKKLPAYALQKQHEIRQHGVKGVANALPKGVQVHDFHRNINRYNGDKLDSGRVISPDDYSSFYCTGGTTGLPKIAMRTHRNEINNTWSVTQFFGTILGEQKRMFCGLPLFHVNAVLVMGLLPFSRGIHVVLGTPQGYRGDGLVKNFWQIIEHYRINFFTGVPTLYASLLEVPFGNADVSSLEYAICGAAPLPVEVERQFCEKTGIKILEGYGLTEGTCVSSLNPPLGETKIGSIGIRIPNQAMQIVLLDEAGQFVRVADEHEIGSVVIAGTNVFSGYLIESQNKKLWVDTGDGKKWLNTGDLGYQDGDGYFFLTGRKKELIIRGGHNIDPQSIEEPLSKHPAVALVAAVPRPDRQLGELPVAYVQLKENANVSVAQLEAFAKEHILERAAVPKHIEIIDKLPLTAVGKIYKVALKHREIKAVLKHALTAEHIAINDMTISEDSHLGTVVTVALADKGEQEKASHILAFYPFHLEFL